MLKKVPLINMSPACAIFGSARLKEDHPHYIAAMEIAKKLSNNYISIMTGGGPGIMEAANKGAFAGRATSIGFRINLPYECSTEPERYHHITFRQDHFHFRQTALIENADAFIAMMGGVGTEFEVHNVITLMQTDFLERKPVYLYDSKVWKTFEKRFEYFIKEGLVSPEDRELFVICDDIDELVEGVMSICKKKRRINT